MPNLKDVNFGFANASVEIAEDPRLVADGFLDFKSVIDGLKNSNKFLILGYKGAGKSIISERLKLLSDTNPLEFVSQVNLEDFPFTTFSKIIKGDAEPESKYPDAWSWILLIYLFHSFRNDEGLRHQNKTALIETVNILEKTGILPNPNLKQIVNSSAKKTFSLIGGGKVGISEEIITMDALQNVPNFVMHMKELAFDTRSDSTHLLVIDGLDDILSKREVQYTSLGALIFEASRLNLEFKKKGVPAKIIVLCRTDLFERLSGANKNKVRQDSSFELDWYHDPADPYNSMLVKAANLRASLYLGADIDIFKTFFHEATDRHSTLSLLLDHTRHTPRDFLQLLQHIKNFYRSAPMKRDEIFAGIRQYSNDYFYPEILDEMYGYFDQQQCIALFDVISKLRKRDFHQDELIAGAKSDGRLAPENIIDMLKVLFDCGAIGNIYTEQKGKTFYSFKYRNKRASLAEGDGIMLHRGLWKSMNLI